jgi:segregation and condensation protein B
VSDERPDSLAAQAASWVPPWERQQPPDREFQAAAESAASAGDTEPDDDEDRSAAGLDVEDDDFDESFEGANPPGYDEDVPPELPPLAGESEGSASVDAPVEVANEDEPEPTDVGSAPEVPVPAAIEDATEEALESERGASVDAEIPDDGDDAGGVFDAAADDDVSDDADVDLPFTEDVPDPDVPDPDDVPDIDGVPDPDGGPDIDGGPDPDGVSDIDGASDVGVGAAAAFAAGAADTEAALAGKADDTERAKPRSGVPSQPRGSRGGADAVGESGARTEEEALADADRDAGDESADNGLAPLDDGELRAALEAILLVVDEPVAEMQLAQIMEQPTERVAAMLEDISARYTAAGHGFDLRRAAGGWRLYTRPEFAPYVERFVLDGQSVRLTQAALETLAVVAYKQPVTRSRISAIRGVNCDGVMRTLTTRGLIEECGTEGETGAYLYRTTPLFLEKLGLNSVEQLPPLAPFLPDDVDEVLDSAG